MAKELTVKGISQEELQRALDLLKKEQIRKERVARGELKPSYKKVSEMTPEEREKYRQQTRRTSARERILLRKAREAGLTVSDQEIDEYLNRK